MDKNKFSTEEIQQVLERDELEVAFPLSEFGFDESNNRFFSNGRSIYGESAKESYELLVKLKENILKFLFKDFIEDLKENIENSNVRFVIENKECKVFLFNEIIVNINRDAFIFSYYDEKRNFFKETLNSIQTKLQ